jgi:hypothetical protein
MADMRQNPRLRDDRPGALYVTDREDRRSQALPDALTLGRESVVCLTDDFLHQSLGGKGLKDLDGPELRLPQDTVPLRPAAAEIGEPV